MPKASTKKTSTKKSPKRATSKTVAPSPRRSASAWSKSFLAHEQAEFHRNHPNANSLITTFIIAFGLLVIFYVGKLS
jgi:hypothetical protein